MEETRWLVETSRNEFEDVGAHGVTVTHDGVLLFTRKDGTLIVAYAVGQRLTVVPEEV